MYTIDTCPICGNQLHDICYTVIPPIYAKECSTCGWKTETERQTIVYKPFISDKLLKTGKELSEFFHITCDLCNKYFNKDGSCPTEIETCNSKEHWGLLLERITNNEKDRH